MKLGLLTMDLHIENAQSLKEKRMVLHSLKARLKNGFNVAMAQVGDEDKWQRTLLAVVTVSRAGDIVNSTLSHVVDYVKDFPGVSMIEYEIELL